MSDSVIQPHNEITGLVPVGHHQHEESRKFQKRKKRKKDKDASPEISDEAVEDLLHHPEEEDASDAAKDALPEPGSRDDPRDHLDLLL
ncbi:MAG: hypothetical protein JW849_03870 [Phycisphaerae bacterium]|nr:hypothetical protein [Phycisphaerae bacterium]